MLLRTRGLTKRFGRVQALRGLDLDVPPGGIFGVVGPNGAGKTTLFSVISGYLPADSGTVEFQGQALARGAAPPVGRFAILPQDASFIAGLELGPQLRYYGQLQGLGRAQAEQEARRVLELVGLPEVFDRRATTLSHGMYKRVGINADLVAFRLGRDPEPDEITAIQRLEFVTGADWNPDEDRLRVRFDPELRRPGEAARDLVTALVDAEIPFAELQIGKSLEDRFLEETRSASQAR
jgi:ABC-type transport system involved in cytochrome c biogenesis ATPase subunit